MDEVLTLANDIPERRKDIIGNYLDESPTLRLAKALIFTFVAQNNPVEVKKCAEEIVKYYDKIGKCSNKFNDKLLLLAMANIYEHNNNKTDEYYRDFDILRILLEYGLDPNKTYSWSPLKLCRCVEEVELLLEYGVNINTTSVDYDFVLDAFVEENNLPVVKTLLAYGANPNLIDGNSNYSQNLNYAIKNNNMKILKILLLAGANPNREESHYITQAVKANNLAVVELLIQHGAKIFDDTNNNETTSDEHNPIIAAIQTKNLPILELLLKKYNKKLDNIKKYLLLAIKINDYHIFKELLDHNYAGFRPSFEDTGNELTRTAIISSSRKVVDLLLEYVILESNVMNCIVPATQLGDIELIKKLLEKRNKK